MRNDLRQVGRNPVNIVLCRTVFLKAQYAMEEVR